MMLETLSLTAIRGTTLMIRNLFIPLMPLTKLNKTFEDLGAKGWIIVGHSYIPVQGQLGKLLLTLVRDDDQSTVVDDDSDGDSDGDSDDSTPRIATTSTTVETSPGNGHALPDPEVIS